MGIGFTVHLLLTTYFQLFLVVCLILLGKTAAQGEHSTSHCSTSSFLQTLGRPFHLSLRG